MLLPTSRERASDEKKSCARTRCVMVIYLKASGVPVATPGSP
jgi:hypothetical protein